MSFPSGSVAWNDRPSPLSTKAIAAHGDSISLTSGVQKTYLPRLVTLIGTPVRWKRAGANGHSWNYVWPSSGYTLTLAQDAPVRVDPVLRYGLEAWLIAFAGTNGITLAAHSAATEYADFQTYIAARIAAGWNASRIIVCTMLPRTGVNETTRGTYNSSLVSGASTYGYKLARLDSDASIGAGGQDTNTTWFLDGTHPTDAGHAIIASIIYAVMFP